MKKWKLLKSEKILQNKWLVLEKNQYHKNDGGIVDEYYRIVRNDYVVIIAIDKDENIIMERQYRVGADKILLELPAGFIDKGEKPKQAALRELQEETGYIGKNPKYLGYFYPSAGFITFKAHVVVVKVDGHKTIKNLDQNEEIEVLKLPLKKVYKMIRKGEITDVSALLAIEFYKELTSN